MFDTRELGRRPGTLKRLSRTVEAPDNLGVEVIRVPRGAPLELELRMESVMEGVLVTGTVRFPLAGECVRCLEPLAREGTAEFQELFSYPDSEFSPRFADAEDEEADEERLFLQNDLFDLEPVVRDAIVLALPLRPTCRENCPGLCPDCGARLAEDPDHQHDEPIDIRWAALREFAEARASDEPAGHDRQAKAPRASGDEPQEK
ncbi:DUF177 domain-containing protein [Streptomyces sp. 3MP-14]|uniref:DUF177 domain-containing protein n=1 Tax=Streptomyces mimosae TaxID=2586635 RepID=A0A5N6A127_9ACTN|nr:MULTISPECIES: DUF177 domain-containing protein [Streptomyces]KAB8161546.1 DUF177 domain-containing protein [Streptomyces mimosae]KAB8173517.1 DUF177 domain-containing protein [Streptomyces sp. 3MP-14]